VRERDQLENTGIDERIVLKWVFRKLDGGRGMDWMELAQDRDRWHALVTAGMNLRTP
jgi:hypothetical protein